MKKKKLTVTIGITAYNEEKNIGYLLESLLKQKEKTIVIKEIIVVSDGSTDNTVFVVQSFKEPWIRCLVENSRLGKSSRLNQLFVCLKTDILVILDADTICKDSLTIETLMSGFKKNKNVGLVIGNRQPLPAKTFIEHAINNYIYARNSVSDEFDFGKTGYSAHGFLAYSEKFLQNFHIPASILNDDAYSYFYCISKGYEAYFEKNAIALYRSPQTVKDHINQSTRHLAGGLQLKKYFDPIFVDKEFTLPTIINIKLMLYQLIKNPLGYIYLKLLNTYCAYKSRFYIKNVNLKWEPISTSKNLVISK